VRIRPESSKREDAIKKVRELIKAGSYSPGDRLPPERELIDELGMSRTILRRALEALEREGAIWRHVGKGTFVASHGGSSISGGINELSRQLTPVRMIQARLCIEPAIAREAAINASEEAIISIKLAKDRVVAAPSWDDYATQDDLFHRSIAEAADNILLLAFFDQLNQVRRVVAWNSVIPNTERPLAEHSSFDEHDQITRAIETRDPNAANEAMHQHIRSVSERMFKVI